MSDIIFVFAFTSSIIFSLSQSYIVYNIKRNKRIALKNISSLSIISCLIYQLMWFIFYSEERSNIRWCYFVGIIFSFSWLSIYLFYYSKENQKRNNIYFLIYIFIILDLIFEIWFIENDILNNKNENLISKNVVKILSSIFNILMYNTPGLNIFKVFKELDCSYIIIPIAIIGFFNSFIWLLYGILSNDKDNHKVYFYTNIIGLTICLLQIVLYLFLRNKNGEPKIKNETLISDLDSQKSKKKKKNSKNKSVQNNDFLTIV